MVEGQITNLVINIIPDFDEWTQRNVQEHDADVCICRLRGELMDTSVCGSAMFAESANKQKTE